MADRSDRLERIAASGRDLHGIATWEPRSLFDRLLARYTGSLLRAAVIGLALLLFILELLLLALQIILNPGSILVLILFPISVLPALILTGYVWYADISREPVLLLLATYVLGVLLATFPTVSNTLTSLLIEAVVPSGILSYLVQVAHFYLVVAPGEELAKLGAVFVYAYWKDDFDTVVDGAVYGAVAGLGFATIENIAYIIRALAESQSALELLVSGGIITFFRSIAGPGHVIWTGLAGYYLGLAKFNDEHALAITMKGLLLAMFLHGTYNATLLTVAAVASFLGVGLLALPVSVGFIIWFHVGALAYLLLRVRRYRQAYAAVTPGPAPRPPGQRGGRQD